ncbi:hypothetical protein HYPSUDRAFT_203881 [Hypholoma sublateritium FD-334 SS-4]|uniref:Uncharacterized protein n=1 Tax=Hypholoma sublateritium (strain FD-334 SS-4) TaxID=945553 RepID=A0A0D2MAJ6_HYPSF|nr:hypothetical protein HYPSUDRAFT_203881 [Hypholoma sublateritium FD-334 SS-4]
MRVSRTIRVPPRHSSSGSTSRNAPTQSTRAPPRPSSGSSCCTSAPAAPRASRRAGGRRTAPIPLDRDVCDGAARRGAAHAGERVEQAEEDLGNGPCACALRERTENRGCAAAGGARG